MKFCFSAVGAVAFLFLAACASTPKAPTSTYEVPAAQEETGRIDYNRLQTALGLDRPTDNLGFAEKSFNTCEAGYGFSRSQNCHTEYFVVVNFRLMCRDTEGTISTVLTDADVAPIAGKSVKWQLKGQTGTTQTDGWGYAQIRAVVPSSQARQRLRLAVGNEFLYMRANEITKVITPKPWCDQ